MAWQLIVDFYKQESTFGCNIEQMKQMRTVYKTDDKFNVQFAATFFIIEFDTILYAFVELIRTSELV